MHQGDIIWIEAAGNYSVIYNVQKNKVCTSKTLKHYERLLDPHAFCRIHKSSLINLTFVERITNQCGYHVLLKHGYEVTVSIRKKSEFKRRMAMIGWIK